MTLDDPFKHTLRYAVDSELEQKRWRKNVLVLGIVHTMSWQYHREQRQRQLVLKLNTHHIRIWRCIGFYNGVLVCLV